MLEYLFDYCFTRRQNTVLFGWTVLFAIAYAILTVGVAFWSSLPQAVYEYLTLTLLALLVVGAMHRFAKLAWWWYQGEGVFGVTRVDYPHAKSLAPLVGLSIIVTLVIRIATLSAMKLVVTPVQLGTVLLVAAFVATLVAMVAGVRLGIWLARRQSDPADQVHA